MTPTVSIVIPTFNRADLLSRAIDSALAQTISCEVVVVDHGSSDHTPDVAKRYGEKILYVRRERDFGPHYCWLDGVMHSSGELVHLQYDDDWIEDRFIEACLDVIDDDTGFAFSVSRIQKDSEPETNHLVFDDWLPDSGIYPVSKIEKKLMRAIVSPGCCVFRRQILIDGLYQGQLPLPLFHYHGVGPDRFITLLSMLRYPKIGFVQEALAVFLDHPGSITINAASDKNKAQEMKKAYKEVRRFYKELKAIRLLRRIRGIQ
jgi:glycosyltransferase involved in cell wall biosynthesis